MSEAAAQEPTMEEILASIRRIISEDEAPAPAAAEEAEEEPEVTAPVAAAPAPAPEPAAPAPVARVEPPPPPPPAAAAPREDVLELTQRVEPAAPPPPAPPPSLGDLDFSDAHVDEPPPPPARKVEGLVSEQASAAAAGHFGALSQSLLMPAAGRTLEDVVKELMKPMLKAWLDENLPSITEAAVRSEVERTSRRGH